VYRTPYQLDITVPLADSGAFHIFRALRRANAWYRNQGMAIPATTIVWNQGYSPVPTSHFDPTTGQIHLLGTTADPDQWDDSVILHEIGHRATALHSRNDSPNGPHTRSPWEDPRLAWSEGVATYLGQIVLDDRRYVDLTQTGKLDYNIDDLSGVKLGTKDDTEAGDISEGLVMAALWDLEDPTSTSENDNLTGLNGVTLKAFRAMSKTSNLNKGVNGQTDFADFVKLSGCGLSTSQKNDMHTLLDKRFNLDWLKSTGFCN
jgi:hypothetical protein